ncbi:response regulator [uncultured Cohaesibacter sp.]|uniref:response regulator n=1 Tax=uncultured Cohaesibacter sp. TaxID=1002546 RepID=UPI0029C67248|nr:response regulator [uncultured Cohaesibacter sp.]
MQKGKGFILVAASTSKERRSVSQALRKLDPDIPITEIDSAAALRDALAERPVDVLFLSEEFSNGDGLDVIEQLGQASRGIFTILMADYFSPESLARASKAGLYDCIQTPLSEDDLKRILKRREMQTNRLSALVVDSQPAARHIIFKLMSESRFDLMTSEAATGLLAISLCRSIPYHILLVDADTKDWNGPEMVKFIQKRQAHCRIILMSSKEKERLADQYEAVGLSGFLKKPFYAKDLDRLLHSILGIPVSNLLKPNFFEEQRPLAQEEDEDAAIASDSDQAANQQEADREVFWL